MVSIIKPRLNDGAFFVDLIFVDFCDAIFDAQKFGYEERCCV